MRRCPPGRSTRAAPRKKRSGYARWWTTLLAIRTSTLASAHGSPARDSAASTRSACEGGTSGSTRDASPTRRGRAAHRRRSERASTFGGGGDQLRVDIHTARQYPNSSGRESAPYDARHADDREGRGRRPRDRGDEWRVEVGARLRGVEEDRDERDVARAVDPGPERVVHAALEPARDRHDHDDVERDRPEPDRKEVGLVRIDERHDDIDRTDLRRLVEQQ